MMLVRQAGHLSTALWVRESVDTRTPNPVTLLQSRGWRLPTYPPYYLISLVPTSLSCNLGRRAYLVLGQMLA